jgi:hypothetical protein
MNIYGHVGFEVFTAVVMKSIIFWDITPCSPLSVNRRLEEHIASIFRVEEISSARNNQMASDKQSFHAGLLLSLFLLP